MQQATDAPIAYDCRGVRCRVWSGAGLFTDFRNEAHRPFLLTRGVHALSGFEIPYLPEPLPEEDVSISRAALYREHQSRFFNEMHRMLCGLHHPVMWRGSPRERLLPTVTFDLRIANEPQIEGSGRLRTFLLVKVFVQLGRESDFDDARILACEKVVAACQQVRALAPRDLTVIPVFWDPLSDLSLKPTQHICCVDDEGLGLTATLCEFGDIRRENLLSQLQLVVDYQEFCNGLHEGRYFAAAQPWPESSHDLLPSCKVIAAAKERLVLSVRIQPTYRTQFEHRAILEFLKQHRGAADRSSRGRKPLDDAVALFERFLKYREFFYTTVQVAGQSATVVSDVMSTYASEQMVGDGSGGAVAIEEDLPRERPARLLCLNEREKKIASFNLCNLDFLPWGGVSDKVVDSSHPGGSGQRDVPNLKNFVPTDELRKPETFLRRDLELNPWFTRLRCLLSVRETANLWRIPVVSRIGQAGMPARMPNPFQQFPLPQHAAHESVVLGYVDHGEPSGPVPYRLPVQPASGGAGLGGQTMLVAGTVASGKTSFALNLLRQLWPKQVAAAGERVPFLVLDISHRGYYRRLRGAVGDELQVFRCLTGPSASLRLDPFELPAGLALAEHLYRLSACFAALDTRPEDGKPFARLFSAAFRQAYWDRSGLARDDWHPAQIQGPLPPDQVPDWQNVRAILLSEGNSTALPQGRNGDPEPHIDSREFPLRLNLLCELLDELFTPEPVPWNKLLSGPVVVEFGGLPDESLRSMLAGLLVNGLIERLPAEPKQHRHALLVDDIHRFRVAAPSYGAAAVWRPSPLDTAIEELSRAKLAGQCVLILDQAPSVWLRAGRDSIFRVALQRINDLDSFSQLADRLNLNTDQRQYARFGLRVGETILLDPQQGLPFILLSPPTTV